MVDPLFALGRVEGREWRRLHLPQRLQPGRRACLCVAFPALGGLSGHDAGNRATTIVDKDGVVRYHWVAESLGVEPDYAEIYATVAALP